MILSYHNLRDVVVGLSNPILRFEDQMISKSKKLIEKYEKMNLKQGQCRYLLIGDSHTYGLNNYLTYEGKIINIGVNGDSTRGVLLRVEKNISNIRSEVVIIQLGYNDLKYRSVNAALKNYKRLLNLISSQPVYIVSLFPVNSKRIIVNRQIILFNQELRKITEGSPIYYFINAHADLYNINTNGLKDIYDKDGVHLNDKGYEVYIRRLNEAVFK